MNARTNQFWRFPFEEKSEHEGHEEGEASLRDLSFGFMYFVFALSLILFTLHRNRALRCRRMMSMVHSGAVRSGSGGGLLPCCS
jgi:hypothetical protein